MLNNMKDILTLKELQHIGKNTALRLVQSGEIETFRAGKQWRVARESVKKYIARFIQNALTNYIRNDILTA